MSITNTKMNTLRSTQKGKHASSTEIRRIVWEYLVWPLVVNKNDGYFTLKEYQNERKKVCYHNNIPQSKISGGLVSLLCKGVLCREGKSYFINYKLWPYLKRKANINYSLAIKTIYSK